MMVEQTTTVLDKRKTKTAPKAIDQKQNNTENREEMHFDWETYLEVNMDVAETVATNAIPEQKRGVAWNHWIASGKNEERELSFINNTNIHKSISFFISWP